MKAKYYFENKDSGLEFSSIDFKQAYSYFIYRQFKINLSKSSFDQKDAFIWDFYVDDIFYRELYEDILYILLNLLLADKIVGNEALVNSLDNDNKFFGILEGIIKNHYDQNKEGYETLKNLRLFTCNNYLTTQQIKNIIKIGSRGRIYQTFCWASIISVILNVPHSRITVRTAAL